MQPESLSLTYFILEVPPGTLVALGFEEPLQRWDAEVGVLLPVLSNYLGTKVIAGLYSF